VNDALFFQDADTRERTSSSANTPLMLFNVASVTRTRKHCPSNGTSDAT
jgi:hypothetical protein